MITWPSEVWRLPLRLNTNRAHFLAFSGGSTKGFCRTTLRTAPLRRQRVQTRMVLVVPRPTVTFNTITRSADAAMSADPDSFEETNFHGPRSQAVARFTSDYDRVGPDIHGNLVVDNSSNGLFARIVTPSGNQLKPLTVAGRFSVTSQDNSTTSFAIGSIFNKVGRTTGWTQGPVSRTCVNTNVLGSKIHQLCQTFVTAGVNGGDSGSPVFRITSGDNVQFVGILWGGGSDYYVMSPLASIQAELGSVNAVK